MQDSIAAVGEGAPVENASMAQTRGLSMFASVAALWLLFWPGLTAWWLLVAALFRREEALAAVVVAYALPLLYLSAALLAARSPGRRLKMMPLWIIGGLSLAFGGILLAMGERLPQGDLGPYLGIAFIAAVMGLMQYPKGGLERYSSYRSPLFIGGVIFMPFFIYIAAMLPNVPPTPSLEKAYLFPIGMLGFWASAAWLALPATQGRHVPNLELRPLMPFRPDYILPGGVNYVKGTILMGVGLMVAIHPQLGMPRWNWWGFVLAFWGIITLIPLRGMFKMVKSRRLRLLGLGGTGFGHETVKGLILFVGLLIMLYGFVNAFFGTVPFETLGVLPEFNVFASGTRAGQAISILTLLGAFAILLPLRGWYKTRLLEGVETRFQMFVKQALLWLGTLSLLIAFVHGLNLPPIRGTGVMGFYPQDNPLGFVVGLALFVAGSALILVFRPLALRNEMAATMKTMVGVASDQDEAVRSWMLDRRVHALAAMPEAQRDQHFRWMAAGLAELPLEKRSRMTATQMLILAEVDSEVRMRCMRSMDKVFAGGGS